MKYLFNAVAFIFTACFFGHDIHYTFKYIGITFNSIFFLVGLFWFHAMILIRESGHGEIHCPKALRSITWLRRIILLLSVACAVRETLGFVPLDQVSAGSIIECAVSILMIVFPDKVFHLIFQLKLKKVKRKVMERKDAPGTIRLKT